MTSPPTPRAPQRRRGHVASIVVGVCIALAADAVALTGIPTLRATWESAPSTIAPTPSGVLPTITTTPATPTSPRALPTSGEVRVTDAISRGIVLIDAELTDTTTSSGTGMVLTSSGEVLTNYHVVRSTRTITVRIASTKREYTATLVGRDATQDVALLQLQGAAGLETITPNTDQVSVDDPVIAAGNAGGQGYLTAFAGRILGTDRTIRVRGGSSMDPVEDLRGLLESNAHAEPGDSGGPLYDRRRQVVGMTTAGNAQRFDNGTAFAVPIASALGVVSKIRAGDNSGTVVIGPKASIGIMASDGDKGIKVTTVIKGSPADKAGMKNGDILTALDDHTLDTVASLVTNLDHYRPGTTATLHWERDGDPRSATVALVASSYN